MKWLPIAFLVILNIQSAYAEECDFSQPEFKTISVPVDYAKVGSPTFGLHVKVIERFLGAPYLVIIPGGPGGTSMRTNAVKYPSGFNLVLTDPRTIGCNSDNPKEAFASVSTETLALDIANSIAGIGIKDFVIYGQSYGTQVATVLTEMLEKRNLKPRALVLEGVVGGVEENFLTGYNAVLERLLLSLTPDIAESIRSINPGQKDQLGYPPKLWAVFFLQMLGIGKSDPNAPPLLYKLLLEGFSRPSVVNGEILLKYMLAGIEKDSKASNPEDDAFFLKIACTESYTNIPSDYLLSGGLILPDPHSKNKCQGYQRSHPYDPSNHRIYTPIWYFQGTEDPATPLEGAIYHFESQTFAERTFIKFIGAGHAATAAAPLCAQALWKMILDGRSFTSIDGICELPVEVEQKYPLQ